MPKKKKTAKTAKGAKAKTKAPPKLLKTSALWRVAGVLEELLQSEVPNINQREIVLGLVIDAGEYDPHTR